MTSVAARQRSRRTIQFVHAALSVAVFSISSLAGQSLAATITVTGIGDTTAVDGIVTLREAIESINAGANVSDVVAVGAYGTADTIDFAIAGGGVHTIAPSTPLPNITKPVTINGYSQPGATANTHPPLQGSNAVLLIELNLAGAHALTLAGGNSTVRGLVINRSHLDAGISVITHGGNTIAGNFIGTNPAGTAAGPGNDNSGITLQGAPTNTVGGLAAADMNVISGNTGNGIICCSAGASDNVIQNNLIGTNAAGNAALANTAQGISMPTGTGNLVGSTNPVGRNVISANGQHGILLNSNSNTIEGNFIGTDVTGTAALANGDFGISLAGGANTIGGTAAGAGNVISGNSTDGILIGNQGQPGNTIQGNLIGSDVTGTVAITGQSVAGINVGPFSVNNLIGGTVAGAGNLIAFSGGNGVLVGGSGATGATGNSILGNRIVGNAKLGIKLGTSTDPNVPTPNDSGDGDTGPNTLQNYPILSTASITGTNVAISGALNSTAGTAFRVELFSNVVCDATGNGEGQSFLGFATVTTDGGGNVSFGPTTVAIPSGQKFITATATNPANNTSEFSPCILATGPPALVSASSRKVHGAAGTFNLALSLVATSPTTEPRQSSTATIVMTFDSAIVSANAAVTEGSATAGALTFSGNDVTVPLTGVTDQHYVTVSLTNVASSTHTGGSGSVRIGFLLGDVSQNRVVTVSDLAQVNAQLAQAVTASNFLKDVNVSGTLSVADKAIANANLTHALPVP
jgi:hypothetical protein